MSDDFGIYFTMKEGDCIDYTNYFVYS